MTKSQILLEIAFVRESLSKTDTEVRKAGGLEFRNTKTMSAMVTNLAEANVALCEVHCEMAKYLNLRLNDKGD